MIILTLNCGSSSVKYQIFNWDKQEILANGIIERLGTPESFIKHYAKDRGRMKKNYACANHKHAIEYICQTLTDKEYGALQSIDTIKAVGHRVVHGADEFSKSTIINKHVLDKFREVCGLSPLHNPANIMGIEAAQEVLPDIPHCAIMDTAWHQTMPRHSYLYALPYNWYKEYKVRRYGFHGTSFLYISKRAAVLLGKKPQQINLICLHIGNGVSANAIKNGVSVDTSMGLTPLEGLVMGTRSGDIDAAIIFYIANKTGLKPAEIEKMLNKKSGILGITQQYIDRRDVIAGAAEGDELCRLAIDIETYRLKKYIGAYYAAIGRLDAIVFTAGAGEMSPTIRAKSLEGLEFLGIIIDTHKNQLSLTRNAETDITGKDSRVKIFVIPTDEEMVMTEDTYALLQGKYDVHTNFTYSFQDKNYVNKTRALALQKELEQNPQLKTIIARP